MKREGFCGGWEFSRDGGSFEPVILPHDAMLGAQRSADAPARSASGYFHGGSYRYRKHFELTPELAEGVVLLEFEGIYRDACLSVNGQAVNVPPYGFLPFFADITGFVCAGQNTVEVDCSNVDQPDCRWYSGAGIYRPVWLWTSSQPRIQPEGVRVTTQSINPAVVHVDIDCTCGIPIVRVKDAEDIVVAQGQGRDIELSIPNARLWDDEHPYLYTCEVDLEADGAIVDGASCSFGIRTLEWNPQGFFVNGRETLLRGGCIHCDNGILGAASWRESEFRRVRMLKAAGFNAVRIAHNPAPTALLEACDELGMYVIDEAWDVWYTHKSAHDYAGHFLEWCDFDLRRMTSRDFNHPSVIMYSIGNEIAEPIRQEGVDLEHSMIDLLHALDPTRPVTCGFNLAMMVMEHSGSNWYAKQDGVAEAASETGAPRGSLLFNLTAQALGTGMTYLANAPGVDKLTSPALDALDIAGYNYAQERYSYDAHKHPSRIIVGTETFPYELPRNWSRVKRFPGVIGDFMWAAWDYLGEAGAGSWAYTPEEAGFSKPWPWLLAGSGALDIFGQPNAHAALAAAVWDTAKDPIIMVRPVNRMSGRTFKATWRGSDAIPSWSWSGCEGIVTRVEVYDAHAHAIRLELNGEEIGIARVHDFVAAFRLPYQPGTLRAVALDKNGHELGHSILSSAAEPFHLSARPESPAKAGGIAYVSVTIEGANGIVEANADERLTAHVEGGTLLAFGSANPAPTESFLDGAYTSYRGHAMAVIHRAEPGVAVLTVEGATINQVSVEVPFE